MAKQDYIPAADDAYDTWCDTYTANIDTVLTDVGLLATIADDSQLLITGQKTAFTEANDAKQLAQNKNQTYRNKRKETEAEIRNVVKQVKAKKEYTAAIGERAGLEGDEETQDIDNAKPKLRGKLTGGEVELAFNKPSFASGVQIWSQLPKDASFNFLATDTSSPYIDNRPNADPGNAEKRKYYALFIDKNDKVVGVKSDAIEVLVS